MLNVKKLTDDEMESILGKNKFVKDLCITLDGVWRNNNEKCDVYEIKDIFINKGQYGEIYKACCKEDCQYIAKWQVLVEDGSLDEILKEAYLQNIAAKNGISVNIHEIWTCSKGVFIIMDKLSMTLKDELTYLTEEQEDYVLSYKDIILEKLSKHRDYIGSEEVYRKRFDNANVEETIKIIKSLKGVNRGFIIPEDSRQVKERIMKAVTDCYNLIKGLKPLKIRHYDLHDGNFMKDEKGRWYIIDFGMAVHKEKYNIDDFKDDFNMFEQSVMDMEYPHRGYVTDLLMNISDKVYQIDS